MKGEASMLSVSNVKRQLPSEETKAERKTLLDSVGGC
jgi:hypothetical protein